MTPNQKAFLDMIAISELGRGLLAVSDNGYNCLVGSTPSHPLLFSSYADHPHIYNPKYNSTAAGRYQLLGKYYDFYKLELHLSDFSPLSQDAIAMQQITEKHGLQDVIDGRIEQAIHDVRKLWASFPGAGYGQHENTMDYLVEAYVSSGGTVA